MHALRSARKCGGRGEALGTVEGLLNVSLSPFIFSLGEVLDQSGRADAPGWLSPWLPEQIKLLHEHRNAKSEPEAAPNHLKARGGSGNHEEHIQNNFL